MVQADEDHDSGTESDEEIDGSDLPSAGESRNSLSSRLQGVLSKSDNAIEDFGKVEL